MNNTNQDINNTLRISQKFDIESAPQTITPYGNGHINSTFSVQCNHRRYILQTINRNVFLNPLLVMSNIEKVTAHLNKKTQDKRSVLSLCNTKDNKSYYLDENDECWRMLDFVEDSICLEKPESTADFYECASAFGKFGQDLSDFCADELYETIPDFHNTLKRYNDLHTAFENDICARAKNVKSEIEFFDKYKDFYSLIDNAYNSGVLKKRVCHNDTKINNVMLDRSTRKGLCVIDLDTVMPGFSVTDFGDAIRSGANTATEDEKNPENVHLDFDMFNAFLNGYISAFSDMTTDEIRLLPKGALIMTLECAMRFLSDYLSGDVYFKTDFCEHNFVRAKAQIALAKDIEKKLPKMTEKIEEIIDRR